MIDYDPIEVEALRQSMSYQIFDSLKDIRRKIITKTLIFPYKP